MALSQKHVGKFSVPWFCTTEWKFVYEKIYGANCDENSRREALDIINIWKARTPLLPCGVEGTLIILEALLFDRKQYNDYTLKLLLSTSIMRFLNLCSSFTKKQSSFYATAKRMKLPEWLVSLRHDTAHNQNLPSLNILSLAIEFALNWLHTEYWRPVNKQLKDFVDSTEKQSERYDALKQSLDPLVMNYCYLTLVRHPYWGYNCVGDIPDLEAKEALVAEIKQLQFVETVNNYTKIEKILGYLWQNIEVVLKEFNDVKEKNAAIPELLLEGDCFLCSFEGKDAIFKGLNKNKMPPKFCKIWECTLYELHQSGMLENLIEKLLHFTNEPDETDERKTMAAFWLCEIGKGLSNHPMDQDMFSNFEMNIKLEADEGTYYTQHIPVKDYINLSLLTDIPDLFTDLTKFKSTVLDNPNKYTKIFINQFLNLNPKLKENENEILELINQYVLKSPNIEPVPDKIYTVNDLTELMATEMVEVHDESASGNEDYGEKRWRKVTDIDFEKCPVGVLPWQSVDMNPLLL